MHISKLLNFVLIGLIEVTLLVSLNLELPFLATSVVFLGFFISSRNFLSTPAAIAYSVVTPMTITGVIELYSSNWGIPLNVLFTSVFLVAIAINSLMLLSKSINLRSYKIDTEKVYLSFSLLTPALFTLFAMLANQFLIGTNLSWVLNGDAQTNTTTTHQIIEIGGFPGGMPSLTQGLMAVLVSFSAGIYINAQDFVSMMQIQAVALSLLWAVSSVLFGLIALKEFSKNSKFIKSLAVFIAAVVPYSWFVLQFSLEAGFYNTPLLLIALASSWIFWREKVSGFSRNLNLTVFIFLITSLFAFLCWAPLAIIPGSALLFLVGKSLYVRKNNKKLIYTVLFIISISSIPLYYLVVTPVVEIISQLSASDGYMNGISPIFVASVFIFVSLISVLLTLSKPEDRTQGIGLLIFCISSVAGILLLVLQGFHPTMQIGWYYYPQKMSWITTFFLIFIASVLLVSSLSRNPFNQSLLVRASYFGFLILLVIGFCTVNVVGSEKIKVFPFLYMTMSPQNNNEVVQEIANSIGSKEIRLKYNSNDYLVNQWVFQWEKFKSKYQIWPYAYSLVNTPKDVCDIASIWGKDTRLLSNDSKIIEEVAQTCGQELIIDNHQ